MAGGVQSNWKLTLDPAGTPLVLVAVGDRLADEVAMDFQRLANLIPLVRSAAPLLKDGKNVSGTIGFSRYDDSDTDANARKAQIQSALAALTLGVKPLKLEASGITDRYWQFASALVTTFRPAKYVGSPKARRLTSYQILVTTLSEVAVP
jgi:hypothetical protein